MPTSGWTTSELRAVAGALAAALTDPGVGIGDPVAIDLPAGIPHAVALHGAILAGAVVQSMPRAGAAGSPSPPATDFVDAGWVGEARAAGARWPSFRRHPRSGADPCAQQRYLG